MIFVDTSAFFAVYNTLDPHHNRSLHIIKELEQSPEEQITSNIVVAETLTLLSMRIAKEVALLFAETFEKNNMRIIIVDEEIHQKALSIFRKIKSKNVSFFDCTSFAVMEYLNIRKAFSFDEDFQGYGFELAD